ncbi:MAG: YbaK/EbsC family protein [Candidatus Diapherotrites archaeon]
MLYDFLQANSIQAEIVECGAEVRTAEAVARALQMPVSLIAKTLLFFADENPVLVIVSGASRVSTSKLCALLNARECRLATPEEVEEATGYEVGAVPPISVYGVPAILDSALARMEQIVCGGGTLKKLLKISPKAVQEFGFEVKIADVSETR